MDPTDLQVTLLTALLSNPHETATQAPAQLVSKALLIADELQKQTAEAEDPE